MEKITRQIPIYFGYLRIIISKDFDKSRKRIKIPFDEKANDYDAFVFSDKTKKGVCRYTVFLKPKCSQSIIAHETVHLVNAVYIDSGIQLDIRNDEHQAYLTGWFVRQINKALKK